MLPACGAAHCTALGAQGEPGWPALAPTVAQVTAPAYCFCCSTPYFHKRQGEV
jgi:hypothetical protein